MSLSLTEMTVCSMHSFFAILNGTVGDYLDFIKYQHWEAFSAFDCQEIYGHLRGLFQPALEFVMNPLQSASRAVSSSSNHRWVSRASPAISSPPVPLGR
jgi:hypothetical protein